MTSEGGPPAEDIITLDSDEEEDASTSAEAKTEDGKASNKGGGKASAEVDETRSVQYLNESVSVYDYRSLANEEYVNDAVLNFYLTYLHYEFLPDTFRKDVYIFSSHFFSKLQELHKAEGEWKEKDKRAHEALKKWTKKVNIFEKRMVIFPVCEDFHWYLIIAINPSHVAMSMADTTVKGEAYILVLDSLKDIESHEIHTNAVEKLRPYLQHEYASKMEKEIEFTAKKVPMKNPRVPQQENSADCGLFLLHYVEMIFRNPLKFYWHTGLVKEQMRRWFKASSVSSKRRDVAEAIRKLAGAKPTTSDIAFPDLDFGYIHTRTKSRSGAAEEEEDEEEEDDEQTDDLADKLCNAHGIAISKVYLEKIDLTSKKKKKRGRPAINPHMVDDMHIETEDGEEVELHPPSSPDENDRLKQSEDEDNSRAESKTPDSPELEDSEAEEGECVPPKDDDEAADFKPRGKVRKPRTRKQPAEDYDDEKSPWSKKAYEPESFKPLRKGAIFEENGTGDVHGDFNPKWIKSTRGETQGNIISTRITSRDDTRVPEFEYEYEGDEVVQRETNYRSYEAAKRIRNGYLSRSDDSDYERREYEKERRRKREYDEHDRRRSRSSSREREDRRSSRSRREDPYRHSSPSKSPERRPSSDIKKRLGWFKEEQKPEPSPARMSSRRSRNGVEEKAPAAKSKRKNRDSSSEEGVSSAKFRRKDRDSSSGSDFEDGDGSSPVKRAQRSNRKEVAKTEILEESEETEVENDGTQTDEEEEREEEEKRKSTRIKNSERNSKKSSKKNVMSESEEEEEKEEYSEDEKKKKRKRKSKVVEKEKEKSSKKKKKAKLKKVEIKEVTSDEDSSSSSDDSSTSDSDKEETKEDLEIKMLSLQLQQLEHEKKKKEKKGKGTKKETKEGNKIREKLEIAMEKKRKKSRRRGRKKEEIVEEVQEVKMVRRKEESDQKVKMVRRKEESDQEEEGRKIKKIVHEDKNGMENKNEDLRARLKRKKQEVNYDESPRKSKKKEEETEEEESPRKSRRSRITGPEESPPKTKKEKRSQSPPPPQKEQRPVMKAKGQKTKTQQVVAGSQRMLGNALFGALMQPKAKKVQEPKAKNVDKRRYSGDGEKRRFSSGDGLSADHLEKMARLSERRKRELNKKDPAEPLIKEKDLNRLQRVKELARSQNNQKSEDSSKSVKNRLGKRNR